MLRLLALSVCLSVSLSACLSVCLSVRLCVLPCQLLSEAGIRHRNATAGSLLLWDLSAELYMESITTARMYMSIVLTDTGFGTHATPYSMSEP